MGCFYSNVTPNIEKNKRYARRYENNLIEKLENNDIIKYKKCICCNNKIENLFYNCNYCSNNFHILCYKLKSNDENYFLCPICNRVDTIKKNNDNLNY